MLKSCIFTIFYGILKIASDPLSGICRRLKVFVVVLKDFEVVLKVFVGAIFLQKKTVFSTKYDMF